MGLEVYEMRNVTICGEWCDGCKYKKNAECAGCREGAGCVKMWDNGCEIYKCAADKQLLHCGFCEDFPCKWLVETTSKWNSEGIKNLTELMKEQAVVQSRCGLLCNECEWKETCGCGGCIETNGHPFHGECSIAICCQSKGYIHCGQCPDMPCEQLYKYSCLDKEHGDKPAGARLGVLRCWARENS